MTELTVNRQQSKADHTIGELLWDGSHQCWTCEDVIREVTGQPVTAWKVKGKTAIPAGRYQVISDYSPKFGRDMPHVLNVPDFDGIRIHIGNYAKDTDGCLLLGVGFNQMGVTSSTLAFNEFVPKLDAALKLGEVWITYNNLPAHAPQVAT